MPPKKQSAAGQRQRATKGKEKSKPLASLRRSARLQALRTPRAATVQSAPSPEPLQEALPTSPINPPQPREQPCEDDLPIKRAGEGFPLVPGLGQPLSQDNLHRLDKQTRATSPGNMSRRLLKLRGSKRDQSEMSGVDQTTQTTPSESSCTPAAYRYARLSKFKITIGTEPLPKDIQTRVNEDLLYREVSEERRNQLKFMAEQLCKAFVNVLEGSSREIDCVYPILTALQSMDSSGNFIRPQKLDWLQSLKPSPNPMIFSGQNFDETKDRTRAAPSHPFNGQQQAGPSGDPQAGQSGNQLSQPSPPPIRPVIQVRTPRPDISIGLHHRVVVAAMVKQEIVKYVASDFLEWAQAENILCSNPTRQDFPMRFPFLVIEGKAYATGKQVFEAQNQASVSGTCMLNLQHELANLTQIAHPDLPGSKAPFAFSICSEGPHIELWVHYTISENGILRYNMNLLSTCHTLLLPGVVEFLVMLDRILDWAGTDFVDGIAKQLAWLFKKFKAERSASRSAPAPGGD